MWRTVCFIEDVEYKDLIKNFKGSRSIVFAKLSRLGGSQRFLAYVHLTFAIVLLAFSIILLYCSEDNVDPRKVYIAQDEDDSDDELLEESKE